jgi:hypothetical protein
MFRPIWLSSGVKIAVLLRILYLCLSIKRQFEHLKMSIYVETCSVFSVEEISKEYI